MKDELNSRRRVDSTVMSLTPEEYRTGTSELSFEVQDAWELNICTCCPNSYLLRVADDRFLYLDSWRLTPYALAESFPQRKLSLTVNLNTKAIVAVNMDGPHVSKRPELLDRAFESDVSGYEYRLLAFGDLPAAWRQLIRAT